MTWLQRYRIRHYVRNSIWIFPVAAMIVAGLLVRLLHWFEVVMGWVGGFHADSMRAVLGNLAGAMFTLIVFVCSSLLLVVQLASVSSTPPHYRRVVTGSCHETNFVNVRIYLRFRYFSVDPHRRHSSAAYR